MRRIWPAMCGAFVVPFLALGIPATQFVSTPASAAEDGAPEQSPGFDGPSVISIPYESSIEVKPASGWKFTDCRNLQAAVPAVTTCGPDGFTAEAPTFDPNFDPLRTSVSMQGPLGATELPYLFQLAPPTAPSGTDTSVDVPVPAGARTLIPFSELGFDCQLCTPGTAEITVEGTEANGRLHASVTGAHLSVVPAADTRGEATVHLRLRDDIEQSSELFIVTLHVIDGEKLALRGLHVTRTATEGSATDPVELSIDELTLHARTDPSEMSLAGCGAPLTGTVTCTSDGVITYTPADAGSRDQFAVRLIDTQGLQTLASITMQPDTAALAPSAGTESAKLALNLTHSEAVGGSVTGATQGFTTLMNALGA